MNQSDLARATRVAPSYVNHLVTGRRVPSPEWIDLVSTSLELGRERKAELVRTAATDFASRHGYDLDLTSED